MSTTIVSYSPAHFDPISNQAKLPHTSAAALAEAVYSAALLETDIVYYVDGLDSSTWPNLAQVDNLVGIERGFSSLVHRFRPRQSLLFAVNQETRSSFNKWYSPIVDGTLPLGAISGSYDLHSRERSPTALADKILMVGDNVTLGTYLRRRPAGDLYVVPYGYKSHEQVSRLERQDCVLIPVSSVGTRKGLDFVETLCDHIIRKNGFSLKVVLVGAPSNQYWTQKIEFLSAKYPDIFDFAGWVSSAGSEMKSLLSRSICAVFPSREEGMVGMAIQTCGQGIPTFTTLECGMGLQTSEFLLKSKDADLWAQQIIDFCLIDKRPDPDFPERCATPQGQVRTPFLVKEAVKRFIESGELYPSFWIEEGVDSLTIGKNKNETSVPISEWFSSARSRNRLTVAYDAAYCAISILEKHEQTDLVNISLQRSAVYSRANVSEPTVGALFVGSVWPGHTVELTSVRRSPETEFYSARLIREIQGKNKFIKSFGLAYVKVLTHKWYHLWVRPLLRSLKAKYR